MKIAKLGHCCLLVQVEDVRVLTDPGSYSTLQNEVKDIDVILITHEHPDHLHVESIKTILENNPQVVILTNSGVGKVLKESGIDYTLLENGQNKTINNVLIEGFGNEHAEIYESFGLVQNTGYFINNHFFYPGDNFTNPGKKVDILALPVAGPWMKIKQAIEYAKEIKPKICFPVHDGMLQKDKIGPVHRLPENVLSPLGINFKVFEEGKEEVF